MEWLLAGLGLTILLLAGDVLVRGAVNVSLRLGVPALIVSLTIVAFGTSAPELLIAISAAMRDSPGIALGNVVGSNTANVLLVLGLPALLVALHTSNHDTKSNYLHMIAASVLFIALAMFGTFTWISALILLAGLALMLFHSAHAAHSHRQDAKVDLVEVDPENLEVADPDMPWWKIWVFLVLGLIGLPLGADILVDSARVIAARFGVSETVIGLTLVAVGTSLPELATSTMAALRRQADVAIGNVIGSNMFNLLAIIGVAALITPIEVEDTFLRFDLWVMLGSSLLLVPFVFFGWNITRTWGVVLTLLYVLYVVVLVV